MKPGSFLCIMILSILIISSCNIPLGRSYRDDEVTGENVRSIWADHSPISITGNSALISKATSEGWQGSGTENDPINISNYRIVARTNFGIQIASTTLYLLIFKCNISESSIAGIYINNAKNVTLERNLICGNQGDAIRLEDSYQCNIENNTMHQEMMIVTNYNGIHLIRSDQNRISFNDIRRVNNDAICLKDGSNENKIFNNHIEENLNSGISVDSEMNTIENNLLLFNKDGVKVKNDRNLIKRNRITSNSYGVFLDSGSYNEVLDNIIVRNFIGVYVVTSVENLIQNNYILKSYSYGIDLYSNPGSLNEIYWNILFYNNDTLGHFDGRYLQARDIGGGNQWYSVDKKGNYYWDWRSPDSNSDDIVDRPYQLDGGIAVDPYPLSRSPIPDVFVPPRELTAHPEAKYINLTWKAPYYGPNVHIKNYFIYRSERGGGEFLIDMVPGIQKTYKDPDVVAGRSYYYYITAENDIAESNRSNRVKSSPDTQKPSVSITYPKDGTYLNVRNITIEWTGKDNIAIDRYELKLDDNDSIDIGLVDSYTIYVFNEGLHEVIIRIYDLAEHYMDSTVAFLLDTTLPQLNLIGSKSDGPMMFNTLEPELRWLGNDDLSGIKGYHVSTDGMNFTWIGDIGSYRFIQSYEGEHIIGIMAEDKAGNRFLKLQMILIDLELPQIILTSPVPNSYFNKSDIDVIWSTNDGSSGIDSNSIRYDMFDWKDLGLMTVSRLSGLEEGPHHLYIRAIDKASNEFTRESIFTIDLTPPEVNIIVPKKGMSYNREFDLSWTAYDQISEISHTEISLDGSEWIEHSIEERIKIGFNDDGNHTLLFRAFDLAGNYQEETIDFIFDVTRPRVIDKGPFGISVPVNSNIWVKFSEPMDETYVILEVPGTEGQIKWSGNNLTFDTLKNLNHSKVYSIRVSGSDIAGNEMISYDWVFKTSPDPILHLGEIIGRIIDTNGTPIANASIRAKTGEQIKTGQDGTFDLLLYEGDNHIIVSVEGYVDNKVDFKVIAGSVINIGDIPIKKSTGSDNNQDGKNLSLVLIIGIISILILVAILGVIYQIKKTLDYSKMPPMKEVEWTNVHFNQEKRP